MSLRGCKDPQNPLPKGGRNADKDSGGYTGAYSATNMGSPSSYNTSVNQRLIRSDGADPFIKPATKGSYESDFAGAGPDAPDVGGVDDGRSSPNR